MFILYIILVAVLAYLFGSLNFAIIVTKLFYKKDIRAYGSGNAGMTNVLRTFGKGAAALTVIGDISKGTLSVLFAKWFFTYCLGYDAPAVAYVAAIAAILGHLFPIYFKFKGGKGVSVAAGAIIALEPLVVLALFVIFIIIFAISKMVSLASVICAMLYPFATYAYLIFTQREPIASTILAAFMAITVVYMHRDNIKRLIAGTEYKFGQKKDK